MTVCPNDSSALLPVQDGALNSNLRLLRMEEMRGVLRCEVMDTDDIGEHERGALTKNSGCKRGWRSPKFQEHFSRSGQEEKWTEGAY